MNCLFICVQNNLHASRIQNERMSIPIIGITVTRARGGNSYRTYIIGSIRLSVLFYLSTYVHRKRSSTVSHMKIGREHELTETT